MVQYAGKSRRSDQVFTADLGFSRIVVEDSCHIPVEIGGGTGAPRLADSVEFDADSVLCEVVVDLRNLIDADQVAAGFLGEDGGADLLNEFRIGEGIPVDVDDLLMRLDVGFPGESGIEPRLERTVAGKVHFPPAPHMTDAHTRHFGAPVVAFAHGFDEVADLFEVDLIPVDRVADRFVGVVGEKVERKAVAVKCHRFIDVFCSGVEDPLRYAVVVERPPGVHAADLQRNLESGVNPGVDASLPVGVLPEKFPLFRLEHAPGETEGDFVGEFLPQEPGVGGNFVKPYLVSAALKVKDAAARIAENLLRVVGNCTACH